ncbi:O-acetyl-ADP-ribose deacetylase [compost metagenome]
MFEVGGVLMSSIMINQTILEVIKGDLTKSLVDIIVNAANTSLLGGGGVDGAIHKAGGKSILEECMQIRSQKGGCKVGEAVITTGGNLPARHVIHTVGPVWNNGLSGEEEKLKSCYRNSLILASEYGATSIAFPNISTGIYRYPKQLAAELAITEVIEYIRINKVNYTFDRIQFVCFDEENYFIYKEILISKNK